ncbi:MAG: AAA family ATPase [Granulosicoccaceae bacterium]
MSLEQQSTSVEKRQYYSSSQGPFHSANNIYMFFGGGERGEIVESILDEIRRGDQLTTVHGELGSGKTIMALVLADRLKHRYNTIHYELQTLSIGMLLRHLLIEICPRQIELLSSDMAATGADEATIEQATEQLFTALANPSSGNKPYVLLIDSGASVDADSMQLIKRLSQFQKNGQSAIRIVLFRRIEADAARMVAGQNVINQPRHHYWLRRLTLTEINAYLRHHMMLFDFTQRDMFTSDMAYFIADRSEGVFNSINGLAKNAFSLASLEDSEKVSITHLMSADVPKPAERVPSSFLHRHRQTVVLFIGFCLLISLAVMFTLL